MQRGVGTEAVARSVSHFRANGSWHRMLWPENLAAQECCARVSFGSAHPAGRPELSGLAFQTVSTPGLDTPSLTALHTGSLVFLTMLWNPMTHFSEPECSGSLTSQGCSNFLCLCLTLTSQTLRPGGQNTLWDIHLFHSLQRHPRSSPPPTSYTQRTLT